MAMCAPIYRRNGCVSLQVPPSRRPYWCCLQYSTASKLLLIPPRSGVFVFAQVSSLVFGEVSMTSRSVLHHSSATISAVIPSSSIFLTDNAERVDLSRFLSHIHRAHRRAGETVLLSLPAPHITGNGFEIVIEDNTQC